MTPAEATEAMEIIAMLAKGKNGYVGVFGPKGRLVELHCADGGYLQFRSKTLLDALRKAKAAWEEGK